MIIKIIATFRSRCDVIIILSSQFGLELNIDTPTTGSGYSILWYYVQEKIKFGLGMARG